MLWSRLSLRWYQLEKQDVNWPNPSQCRNASLLPGHQFSIRPITERLARRILPAHKHQTEHRAECRFHRLFLLFFNFKASFNTQPVGDPVVCGEHGVQHYLSFLTLTGHVLRLSCPQGVKTSPTMRILTDFNCLACIM